MLFPSHCPIYLPHIYLTSYSISLSLFLPDTYNSIQPLSSCFHNIKKTSKLKPLGCPTLLNGKMRKNGSSASLPSQLNTSTIGEVEGRSANTDGKRSIPTKRMFTRNTPSKKISTIPLSESDTELQSAGVSDGVDGGGGGRQYSDRRHKQPRFKRGLRSHMWHTHKNEDSDTDDDLIGSVPVTAVTPGNISSYHLARLILTLLQSIGCLDHAPTHSSYQALSATILQHLLSLYQQFRVPSSSPHSSSEELSGISKAEQWVDTQPLADPPDQGSPHGSNQTDGQVHSLESHPSACESSCSESVAPWVGLKKLVLLKQVMRAILSLSAVVATQQNGVRILGSQNIIEALLDL